MGSFSAPARYQLPPAPAPPDRPPPNDPRLDDEDEDEPDDDGVGRTSRAIV